MLWPPPGFRNCGSNRLVEIEVGWLQSIDGHSVRLSALVNNKCFLSRADDLEGAFVRMLQNRFMAMATHKYELGFGQFLGHI